MPLTQITGGGAFTRTNINQINTNFAAVAQPDYWVKPQGPNASNTNPGTYEAPFATFAGTNQYLKPGIVIGFLGVAFENWAPPAVNDVTIVGMATTPRQATDSGIPNGGGATWLNATHTGTPTATSLVIVGGASGSGVSQGWRFQNIYFNNAATGATTADVELLRDATRDAGHASFINCKFTGTNYGLYDHGGVGFITVDGCEFFNFAGGTDTGIRGGAGGAIALPLQWNIKNSSFWNNVDHMLIPLSSGNIYNNVFGFIGSSITTTVIMDLSGGKDNAIWNNKIQAASNAVGITAAVVLGTNDSYGPQFYTDQTEYATPAS